MFVACFCGFDVFLFEGVCETHVILTPGAVEVGLRVALHATVSAEPGEPAEPAGEFAEAISCCVLQ